MEPIRIDCLLKYSHERERLFVICKTGTKGIVVSAADHEVINSANDIIPNLVMNALNEVGQFQPLVYIHSKIEVVDPATMRFLLDAKVEVDIVIYRKCDHCSEGLVEFIDRVTQ